MPSDDVKASNQHQNTPAQAAASQEREIDEWAKSLGIPPGRLKQAVSAVGITPRRIREYLRNNR